MHFIGIEKIGFFKQFSVLIYLKSNSFSTLKKSLTDLFKKEHGKEKFFNVFTHTVKGKQLVTDKTIHPIFASHLGTWSEYFLEAIHMPEYFDSFLKKTNFSFPNDEKILFPKDLKNFDDLRFHALFESIQNTKNYNEFKTKKYQPKESMQYEILETKDSDGKIPVTKNKWIRLLNHDKNYFENIIQHFLQYLDKDFSYLTNDTFRSKLIKKSEFNCEIINWEIDFYDIKEDMVVDLKFQVNAWSDSWMWQTLIYVYLLNFHYGINPKGIKLFNTHSGIEHSATLTKLFGKSGDKFFFDLCKLHIKDQEKMIFKHKIKVSYQKHKNKNDNNLTEIISNLFKTNNERLIQKYEEFLKHIFLQYDQDIFLNENQIWSKRKQYNLDSEE